MASPLSLREGGKELCQIDEQGREYISPSIDDWNPVTDLGIHVIIDMDGDLDVGVPRPDLGAGI